jgi:DNA-binding transcriptional LysR family regulator
MNPNPAVLLNRMLAKLRIRHVQALVKLAELGHVNRTAQALGMTQPAVTLLLADLERLLEMPLFLRHSKGVTPTALALQILPLAQQVLRRLEDSAELISSHRAQDEGTVVAAATVAGVNGLLADTLDEFSKAYPRVRVLIRDADRAELNATVVREAIDIVFCRKPPLLPVGWKFINCRADSFGIVCGAQHPLANQTKLELSDLRKARWLANTVSSAAGERFLQLFNQLDWQPLMHPVVARLPALTWTLLDSQDLLAFVPLSVMQPWLDRGLLKALPIDLQLGFDPLGMLVPESGVKLACQCLVDFFMLKAPTL